MVLKRNKPAWQSEADASRAPTGWSALRQDLRASSGGVLAPVRAVFADRESSRSGRLFTFAEIVADAAGTPVGRIVTAAVALTLAFWLI